MSSTSPVAYGAPDEETPRHPLDVFFAPRSVAVIGASERPASVGRTIFWNLVSNPFGGVVHAVNPARRQVLGIPAHASVRDIPEPPELAIIVTPPLTVTDVLDECIAAGVKAAIIVSAVFNRGDLPTRALEEEIRRRVVEGGIRIIGPNSLGVMNPLLGLNAAFADQIALRGTVGFISQSGAICRSVLDWSRETKTGFSKFVSFGGMVDVQWSDLIYYLGNDPGTRSIVIYMEAVGDARSFLSAAREVALSKPIIVLKGGQTEAGARAARTTGYSSTDTCDDAVLSAALRRCGVLRVDDVETLFFMADALGKQPRPKGPRLTIVSNAAAPGVLATDALIRAGGELAPMSDATLEELNRVMPPYWNHGNPIDIVADADPARYAAAVEIAARDPESDGLLVILTPQASADAARTATAVADAAAGKGKPLLASWMGGETVAPGTHVLTERLVPTFAYPDAAARIFAAMWHYSETLRGLYETPRPGAGGVSEARAQARAAEIIRGARGAGRTLLDEAECRHLLQACGIPVSERPPERDELVLVFAGNIDPQFGPYLTFGAGGPLGAILRDRAIALPPVNSTLARRTMERTRIYGALRDGFGNVTARVEELERMFVRFGDLVLGQPWIRAIEVNPIVIGPNGVVALDAWVTLHDADTPESALPRPAIRPYPSEHAVRTTLKDGSEIVLRPVRPEDEGAMVAFHHTLSSETVYFRYLRLLSLDQRIRHDRLTQLCFVDYDCQVGLVAVQYDEALDVDCILAISRLVKIHGTRDMDFAVVVSDAFQGRGLGEALLRHTVAVARAEGMARVVGVIHPENTAMIRMCKKIGFTLSKPVGDEVHAEMRLE
jgi:acetyltransferase